MNYKYLISISSAIIIGVTGCSSVPQENTNLEGARRDLIAAQNNASVRQYAPLN
jgi:hypothetical protein